MDPAAQQAVHHQMMPLPVILVMLGHNQRIRRHQTMFVLAADIPDKLGGRILIQLVFLHQAAGQLPLLLPVPALPGAIPDRGQHSPDIHADERAAPSRLRLPEGNFTVGVVALRHINPVMADGANGPGAGAQLKRVSRPAFIYILLVQLPEMHPGFHVMHRKSGGLGNSASPHGCGNGRAGKLEQLVPFPVPAEKRPGEGIPPGQHIQHGLVPLPRVFPVAIAAGYHPVPRLRRPLLPRSCRRHGGNRMLGQHIQLMARNADILNVPVGYGLGQHRRLRQVSPAADNDDAAAFPADSMACPAKALDARCGLLGGIDLEYHIDFAHVNAQLQS
ncbi:hypothetical protein D3C75_563610 [compost metagenome]